MEQRRKATGDPRAVQGREEPVDYLSMLDTRVVVPDSPAADRVIRGAKIDLDDHRVVALVVSEKGQPRWEVPITDLQSLGGSSPSLPSSELLQPVKYEGGRIVLGRHGGVIGAAVVSSEDKYKGKIVDLWFSPRTGRVTRYYVSRGRLRDRFTGTRVLDPEQVVSASLDRFMIEGALHARLSA